MSVMISAAVFIAAMIACMIAGVDTFFALVLGIILFSCIGAGVVDVDHSSAVPCFCA